MRYLLFVFLNCVIVTVIGAGAHYTIRGVNIFGKYFEPSCLAEVQDGAKVRQITGTRYARWTVFESGEEENRPVIEVRRGKGGLDPACTLDIQKLPAEPLDLVDWRLGLIIDARSAGIAGRTGVLTITLRSDEEILFTDGQLYNVDGSKVTGVSWRKSTPEWVRYQMLVDVREAAAHFEIWIRTTIHSPISELGQVEIGVIRLTLDPQ